MFRQPALRPILLVGKGIPAQTSQTINAALLLRATVVGVLSFILTLAGYAALGWLVSQIVVHLH